MYQQRCRRARQHGPHYVKPRGSWTGFTCPGHQPADVDRLLTEAFGLE